MSAKIMPRTSASRTNWKKLHQQDDSDIDYSDIPPLDEDFWQRAKLVMPPKVHLSVRLDKDIVDFFKKSGKKYQSKMNAILRLYMEAHLPATGK